MMKLKINYISISAFSQEKSFKLLDRYVRLLIERINCFAPISGQLIARLKALTV